MSVSECESRSGMLIQSNSPLTGTENFKISPTASHCRDVSSWLKITLACYTRKSIMATNKVCSSCVKSSERCGRQRAPFLRVRSFRGGICFVFIPCWCSSPTCCNVETSAGPSQVSKSSRAPEAESWKRSPLWLAASFSLRASRQQARLPSSAPPFLRDLRFSLPIQHQTEGRDELLIRRAYIENLYSEHAKHTPHLCTHAHLFSTSRGMFSTAC